MNSKKAEIRVQFKDVSGDIFKRTLLEVLHYIFVCHIMFRQAISVYK